MAGDDILTRLDATLAENSRVIAENSAVIADNARVFAENSRVFAENARVFTEHSRAVADFRVFTRDLVTRQERFMREVVGEMRDLRAESRAQREALLRLIDRLPPPADGPAPA
ncbi:MAG: hypothetical protein WD844_03645 [Thermoleophilaceae bacterium]